MIILTTEDADKVRGISPTKGFAALDPVPLKDGTFMLPDEVLTDLAHADVKDFLAGLPTIPFDEISALLIYGEADSAELEALDLPTWKEAGTRPLPFEVVPPKGGVAVNTRGK